MGDFVSTSLHTIIFGYTFYTGRRSNAFHCCIIAIVCQTIKLVVRANSFGFFRQRATQQLYHDFLPSKTVCVIPAMMPTNPREGQTASVIYFTALVATFN